MEESLKRIIKFLLTIFIIVLAIKFFIYALPFIIVLLIGYMLYKKIRENSNTNMNKETKSNKKSRVLEAEVVKERVDD